MPMSIETRSELIKEKIPDAEFDIKDLRGDDNHYHAIIKSSKFKGLSKVQQHQLVYDAIGDHMGTTLHALMLTTVTKK